MYWFLLLCAFLFGGWGYAWGEPASRHHYGGLGLFLCALIVIGIKVFPLALT